MIASGASHDKNFAALVVTIADIAERPSHARHPPGPVVVVADPAGVYVKDIAVYPELQVNPDYKIFPGPEAAPEQVFIYA